jgi:hypothetical protein
MDLTRFRRSTVAEATSERAGEKADDVTPEEDPSDYYASPPPEVYDKARPVILDCLLQAERAREKSPIDLIGKVVDRTGVSPHEARRTIAELIVRGDIVRQGLDNLVVNPDIVPQGSEI